MDEPSRSGKSQLSLASQVDKQSRFKVVSKFNAKVSPDQICALRTSSHPTSPSQDGCRKGERLGEKESIRKEKRRDFFKDVKVSWHLPGGPAHFPPPGCVGNVCCEEKGHPHCRSQRCWQGPGWICTICRCACNAMPSPETQGARRSMAHGHSSVLLLWARLRWTLIRWRRTVASGTYRGSICLCLRPRCNVRTKIDGAAARSSKRVFFSEVVEGGKVAAVLSCCSFYAIPGTDIRDAATRSSGRRRR